jgi:hypothetical protein
MRERYERDEGYPGRRHGDGARRRDDPQRPRPQAWEDESGRGGYRSVGEGHEGGRIERDDDPGDDWGDVQIGRWAGGGRRPIERHEPGRWERDESHWGGTTGRWGRNLEREPSDAGGHAEARRWRYGTPDFERDWPPEGGSRGRRTAGRFGGVGPKGYQRSDDRIREDVCDRLTADAWVDPSDVSVRVNEGEVTLEGTIDSRETKRRVEDTVDDVAGVRQVHNFLHVRAPRGAHGGMEHSAPGGHQS